MDKTKFKGNSYRGSTWEPGRDNKDTSHSYPYEYGDRIRVPSLKRSKATWKRFYKRYPQLEGEEIFKGSSRCSTETYKHHLRSSFIKLKKIRRKF